MNKPSLEPKYNSQVNATELLSLELLTSFEKFTRVMFKAQYKRSFIVATHHKHIFKALQDVVDGKCRRLIINMPPRYGKCMALDTPIYTTKGIKLLQDVEAGDKVYSYRDGKVVINRVLATEPAFKKAYRILMRSGRQICCSYDHPMLTTFGYTEVKDIKPGDYIQALRAKIDSEYEISDAELVLTTIMLFEGNCSNPTNYRFATTDPLLLADIQRSCDELGIILKHYDCCKSFEYNIMGGASGKIGQIMKKYNLDGHLAYNKRLPKDWTALSLRQKYKFISLMVATDGCIDQRSGQIVIALANYKLIHDIQRLLSTVGIVSTIVYKPNEYAGAWHLAIPRQYAQELYPHLNFYNKAEVAKSIMTKPAKSNIDTFPYNIIRKEKLTYRFSRNGVIRCDPNKNITREKFKRLVSYEPDKLGKYLSDDFYLDEVVRVDEIGDLELKHLEVENDHNFIANGLVSHNTEVAIKSFISWCFALNPKCRFLHLSYSDMLVNDNSDTVRGIMMEELYKTLFPKSGLASEKGSAKRWKTKAGGELYAVSTQGQVTGFGAGNVDEIDELDGGNDIFTFDDHTNEVLEMIGAKSNVFQGAILIDDPMKPEDADSDIVRERINLRFENTIRNRTNSRNTPIIIIMQRLHEHDLCGYLKEIEPDEWTVLSLPAIQQNPETGEESALWPMKHTLKELYKMREINPIVFDTQYMQDPTPKEGLMYSEGFRTYTRAELPVGRNATQRWNYTDTADTGSDSLCSICFINTPEYLYVTDVLFTDAAMEVTEPAQARMLTSNSTTECLIESNNGGRGYARNVKRILRVEHRNFRCAVNTFTQTLNKKSRIFTASANVQNDVLFPEGWEKKWPKFYQAIMSYRKDNKKKNQHDDAPDCLTGAWEMHSQKVRRSKIKQRN